MFDSQIFINLKIFCLGVITLEGRSILNNVILNEIYAEDI